MAKDTEQEQESGPEGDGGGRRDRRTTLKIVAAVAAAVVIVAVPHLLTVGRGGGGSSVSSHRCAAMPSLGAYHVRVRKQSCEVTPDQVKQVLDSPASKKAEAFRIPAATLTLECDPEIRSTGHKFFFCHDPDQGIQLQFVTGKVQ
jgi:hypothetical protein